MNLKAVPHRAWLLIVTAALLALSLATTRAALLDVIMHHAGTVFSLAAIAWLSRRHTLSNLSYSLVFCQLLLHLLGAHTLYSNVPYDLWSERLFGHSVSDIFGWERNHYDRLVHFCFGALLYVPVMEFARRGLPRTAKPWWPHVIAIGTLSFVSHVYEIIEWLIAVFMSPETAENYNGQQGDMWDAQKDMALAMLGAVLALFATLFTEATTGRRLGSREIPREASR